MHGSSLLIGLLLCAGTPQDAAQGQDTTEERSERPERDPALDVDGIRARLAELQAFPAEERSEDQASSLLRLEGALRALEQADLEWAKAVEYRDSARAAPAEIEELNAKLGVPLEGVPPVIPSDARLEDLTSALQQARADLATGQQELQLLYGQVNDRAERRQEILRLLPTTTEELRSLEESLAAAANTAQDRALDDAIRTNRLARKEAAQARLARLEAENQGFARQTELLRARRDLAQREVTIRQRVVDGLQERVDQMRKAQADQESRAAVAELRRAADAHPVVRGILEMNAELTSENQRIAERLGALAEKQRGDAERQVYLRAELDQLIKQEARFGLSEAVGMRLRSRQADLDDLATVKKDIASLEGELARANERYFELSSSFWPKDEQRDRLLSDLAPEDRERVEVAVGEALQRRTELRAVLRATYEDLLDALVKAHQEREVFADLLLEYQAFVQERIFWVRSTTPLSSDELSKVRAAANRLFEGGRWRGVLDHSVGAVERRPWLFGLTLAAGIVLVAARRLLLRRLLESGKRVRWSHKGSIGSTLLALLNTAGVAATLPGLLWLATLWIGDPEDPQRFGACVSSALGRAALVLFVFGLLQQVCRRGGVGEAHFRWPTDTCAFVRRQLRWYVPSIVPVTFLARLAWQRAGSTHDDSLARLVGLIGLALLALFLDRMFRPKSGLFHHHLEAHPDGWLNRTRKLWFPALLTIPVALGITAALGYTYTASEILGRLANVILLAVVFTIGYGILLRALFLGERRLAIEKFKGQAAVEKSETLGEDDVLDVAKLGSQARAMVRLIMLVGVSVSMLLLWMDILPVLGQLHRVELLHVRTEVDPDGESIEVYLTLKDVLASALIFFATFFISRNLKGILEMLLLRRLPMSSGARYATETLARYLVIIIGLVAGFDRLGIGWSKVQFLAAAVTVGLGFGLQEIFANFVSGLIILFERPIRVGDTVTIGSISGEVTRIRMRATTITDWDRKELIIPNKEFVTGQVINWTLSDPVMRIRIKVGIAYGSDTSKAREILKRVAAENGRVLKDPRPQAVFLGFGDSSLDFELRVFVPGIADYVPVIDEIHEAVDQGFREAGIEIAFPQRDLHIRSAEAPIEVKDTRKRRSQRPRIEELPDPSSM